MTFEKFFRLISYLAVFCGFMALWVSGTFGIMGTLLFLGVMAAAWFFEDSQWQISEKIGTVVIVLALPAFYFLWKLRFFGFSGDGMLPGVLARMILFLSAIKLLQKKSDRDWIFLYLMAFFEVLLAAGLSISAMYLASLLAYLLVMVCAVVAFEMKKTIRLTAARTEPAHKAFIEDKAKLKAIPIRRLPAASIALIVLAAGVGLPLFFLLPRVGGAGFGSSQNRISASSGFSDIVQLGGIGTIQQNDAVVMRVKVDDNVMERRDTHWRGVALDTFDNTSWKKSQPNAKRVISRGEREYIDIDVPSGREGLAVQTIYLEPLDWPVLFGLSKIVRVAGDFEAVTRDSEGSVMVSRGGDRISYRVSSDRELPTAERLQADNGPYPAGMENYMQTPDVMDPRIAKLAAKITSGYDDRYSKAKAMETFLQNNFGYTLEMKAQGTQPLADFLFNVKEGHCEYFATAMAVMLRTQRIGTRVVNGFQQGEYNDAADVWIVRQRHAHSWVEVYFPKERVWVPFDPTPFAGQGLRSNTAGLFGSINKYLEALETFWIQYFVAFDDQEQQSLVRSARKSFADYQTKTGIWLNALQEKLADWWSDVRGDSGFQTSIAAIAYGFVILIAGFIVLVTVVWIYRKTVQLKVWAVLADRFRRRTRAPIVEFYERMQSILLKRGFARKPCQTPLEFAFAVGKPEAVSLTQKYNHVRFGEKILSSEEKREIEILLRSLLNDKS